MYVTQSQMCLPSTLSCPQKRILTGYARYGSASNGKSSSTYWRSLCQYNQFSCKHAIILWLCWKGKRKVKKKVVGTTRVLFLFFNIRFLTACVSGCPKCHIKKGIGSLVLWTFLLFKFTLLSPAHGWDGCFLCSTWTKANPSGWPYPLWLVHCVLMSRLTKCLVRVKKA